MDDTLKKKVINLEGLETMVSKIKAYVASQLVEIKKYITINKVDIAGTTPSFKVSDYTGETYLNCTDTIESLSIDNSATSEYEITIRFKTSSTFTTTGGGVSVTTDFMTIDDPANFDIEDSSEYELSIKNNVFVLGELQTKTVS